MKIVTIVGARPQFIKAAVVSAALRSAAINEVLVHTGQHYDDNMSAAFFRDLGLDSPQHNLGIRADRHGAQTGRMMEAIENVLVGVRPDLALVYGDTNSTLAGALAASKLHIPVAHVEAGLRSFNREMPEETNRVLTDHISALLFAPTDAAMGHLAREGILGGHVHQVGDVMFDAALRFGGELNGRRDFMDRHGIETKRYVLATIHRAENTANPVRLRSILSALTSTARNIPVVLPIHPRTQAVIDRLKLQDATKSLILLPAVSYGEMAQLEKHAVCIATDSGGVQKEAFFHRVPCVTFRTETEWGELVNAGWNTLVDPGNSAAIEGAIQASMLSQPCEYPLLYGDGNASGRIATIVRDFMS